MPTHCPCWAGLCWALKPEEQAGPGSRGCEPWGEDVVGGCPRRPALSRCGCYATRSKILGFPTQGGPLPPKELQKHRDAHWLRLRATHRGVSLGSAGPASACSPPLCTIAVPPDKLPPSARVSGYSRQHSLLCFTSQPANPTWDKGPESQVLPSSCSEYIIVGH